MVYQKISYIDRSGQQVFFDTTTRLFLSCNGGTYRVTVLHAQEWFYVVHLPPLYKLCLQMEKGKGVMGNRKWAVDFTDNSSTPSSRDIPDPPGFTRASHEQDDSTLSRQKKDAEANWKSQKAWEVAQAPFKNLLMMGFMMWMAGSTVHLFSIGITFSALWQPLSALQGVGKVFEPYKDGKVDLLAPKLLYIALNLGGMLLGVWKLNTLGLLPTHASDWVSSLPPAHEVEYSGGGIALH